MEDERQEEIRADDVHKKTDSAIVASLKHSKEVHVCARIQSAGSVLQQSF